MTEKNWSDMNAAEQLARCDEKIAEYEAAGRWQSSRAWKNTKAGILQSLADHNGWIRTPKGDGSVVMTAEEIRDRNAMRRAEAEDRAAAEEAQETAESRSRGGGAKDGTTRHRRVLDIDARIRAAEEAGDYLLSSRLKAMKVHQAARSA